MGFSLDQDEAEEGEEWDNGVEWLGEQDVWATDSAKYGHLLCETYCEINCVSIKYGIHISYNLVKID